MLALVCRRRDNHVTVIRMELRVRPYVALLALVVACGDDPPTEGDAATGTDTGDAATGETEVGDSESSDSGTETDAETDTSTETDSGTTETDTETESGTETDTESDTGALDDLLTLAHVQVKGTHNSYHVEPLIPFHPSHEYTHPPLDEQLEDFGVRAFELDLHKETFGEQLLVYHIFGIDQETTCETLEDCLSTIKSWSDVNQGHTPIMVSLEIKDSTGGAPITDLGPVDDTILAVFPASQVITPDSVRAGYGTIRERLEAEGWPTLGEVRGKVIFMVLNGGHDSVEDYTYGYTSLDGRMMFVSDTDPNVPYAAVAKINDPGSDSILTAHDNAILVTSNTCGADQDEQGCFAELEDAAVFGPHNLMDDRLTPKDGETYFLDLPGGNPALCNPVTAPVECTAEAVEDLP